jgi:hypothetical protein
MRGVAFLDGTAGSLTEKEINISAVILPFFKRLNLGLEEWFKW